MTIEDQALDQADNTPDTSPEDETDAGLGDDFSQAFDEAIRSDADTAGELPVAEENDGESEPEGAQDGDHDGDPEPEPDAEPAPDADAESNENTDESELSPSELAARYEALQASYTELEQRNKSDRGRTLAYEKELRDLRAAQPSAAQPRNQAKVEPPSKDALAAVKTEFAEVAPFVDTVVDQAKRVDHLEAQLNEQQQLARQQDIQHREDRERQALAERHPDYMDIGNSAEFQAWIDDIAPPLIRNAAHDNAIQLQSADDVSAVIDAFNSFRALNAPNDTTTEPTSAAHEEGQNPNQSKRRAEKRRSAQAIANQDAKRNPRGGLQDSFDAGFDAAVNADADLNNRAF